MHKDSTNFKEILELIDDFQKIHQDITKAHPKKLNFLNEIKINEVEHSRILFRLFNSKYKESGESFFKLFLNKLCEKKNSFSGFKSDNKYVFKLEKYNIDLLVLNRASNKAMIIENKINEAIDQNQQLERYVEVCRSLGYAENEIYIIYLTRYGGSPSSESLNPDLSARFNNRIALISYSDFMIEWLESLLNTSYLQEDNTLIQNVKLYADHLKTELGINSTTQLMNKEMIKEVENLCLEKNLDPIQNLDKLKNIEFNINEFQVVLKELKVKVQHELYAKKLKDSDEDIFRINKDNVVCESFNSHYYVGYKAKIKNNVFYIILEDNLGDRPYFGFRKCKEDDSLIPDLRTDLKQIFKEDFNEVGWWYAYKFVDKDCDPFQQFKLFLKNFLKEESVEVLNPRMY